MSENKTAKATVKAKVMYALSIHMKYGEVLHIEGLNKEEKDRYFELARKEDSTMLVEDKTSVIHLLSRDIAKISVKAYDEKYERVYHPLEKMIFSESSVGRRPFTFIIKSFIVLTILAFISEFGVAMIAGNIMDVFFDPEILSETLLKGFDLTNKLFSFTAVLLIILSILDIGLGYKAHYYINQDGSNPVEYSRISNLIVSIVFIIAVMIAKTMLTSVVTLL